MAAIPDWAQETAVPDWAKTPTDVPQLSEWVPTLTDRARQALHAVRTSGPVETLLGRTPEEIAAQTAAEGATTTHDAGAMGLFSNKTPVVQEYAEPKTALEGLHNWAAGVVNSVASPGGIATAPLTGPAKIMGPVVQKALLLTFGAQGAKMTYEGAKDLVEKHNVPDWAKPVNQSAQTVMDIGNILAGGLMAAGGVHALKGKPVVPESPAVRPAEDWLPAQPPSEPVTSPGEIQTSPPPSATAPAEAAASSLVNKTSQEHTLVKPDALNLDVQNPENVNQPVLSPAAPEVAPSRMVLGALDDVMSQRQPVPVSLLKQSGVAPEALPAGYTLNPAGTHYDFTEPVKALTPEQVQARAATQAMAELRQAKVAPAASEFLAGPEEPAAPAPAAAPKLVDVTVTQAEVKAAASGIERAPDVLDSVKEQFPGGVKFDRADHAETVKTARGAAADLMSHTRGEPADVVLDGLHREGLFQNLQSVDDLAEAMKAAGETRIASRDVTPAARELASAMKRTQLFDQLRGNARPGKSEPIPAGQLFMGDQFKLNGKPVHVLEQVMDAETGKPSHVEVDGAFGRQAIPADALVHFDKGSMQSPGLAQTIIDKLEGLKMDTRGQLHAFGLVPEVWNALLKGVQLAVRGGMAIKEAIDHAVAQLKASGADLKEFDEAGARRHIEDNFGVRQFGEQLQGNTDISDALKGQVTNTLYERRPQEEDAAFAQRIVQTIGGPDQARAVFNDQTNGLPEPVRMAIGMQILKGFDAAGRHMDAAQFFDNDFAPHTTDVAQGLAMLNAWHAMSKEGKLAWAQKHVADAARDTLAPVKPDIDAAQTELQRQNAAGIEATTADNEVQTGAKEIITDAVVNSMETHNGIVMELAPVWAQSAYILAKARELVAAKANDLLTKAPRPVGFTAAQHLRAIMDDLAKRAADIAAGHYQGAEPGVVLRDKLVQRLGLSPEAALKLANALDKEFAKQVNDAKKKLSKRVAFHVARQALGKRGNVDKLSRSARDRYAEAAAKNLVNGANKPGQASPALQEFYGRLTASLRKLLPATDAAGKAKLTDLQLVTEALQNTEHFTDVWQRVGTELRAKYGIEGMADITNTLGELTPDALVQAPLDRAIGAQLDAMKMKLGTVVREHWTKVDATKADLADKLVKASGLTGDSAAKLAELIQRRFEALTANAKRRALETVLKPVKKLAQPQMIDRLLKLSNVGAFDSAQFWNAIKERLDLPTWTPELRNQLAGLADKLAKIPADRVEEAQRVQTDFLNAIERAKGVTNLDLSLAFYMQNILSGLTTHVRVAIHTSGQIMAATAAEMSQALVAGRVQDIPLIFEALGKGAGRALTQQKDIFRSGLVVGSKLQKVVPLSVLEQIHFGQKGGTTFKQGRIAKALLENKAATLLNLWKYNARLITAQHMLYFAPAEEMKLALLSARQARTEGLTGRAAVDRARQIMGYGADQVRAAEAQASREGLAGTRAKMRTAEILQSSIAPDMRTTARDYALRQTFLNDPYGFAGTIANLVASAKHSDHAVVATAARVIVPFTRIAANLFNEGLNYTPVGAMRARFARTELAGQKFADITPEVREDLRKELYAKSALGTMLLTGIAFKAARGLNQPNPDFTVYGAGPSDPQDKAAWEAAGGLKYSVKAGNRYVSYANTPGNVMMATLGNYLDGMRDAALYHRPGAERLAQDLPMRAAAATVGSSKVILEQPFLQSLIDLAKLGGEENPELAARGAVKTAARTASSFVVPNLLRQIDKFYDPTSYQQRDLAGILTSQVPFVRQSGRPLLDALGQPIQSPVFGLFTSTRSQDKLVQLLTDHDAWPTTPNRNQTAVNGVPLNDGEFYLYMQTRGSVLAKLLSQPNVPGLFDRAGAAADRLSGLASQAAHPVAKAELTAAAKKAASEVIQKFEAAADAQARAAVIRQRGY